MSSYGIDPADPPDVPGAGSFRDPAAAAFIAFPVAVLCLFGASPLSGYSYTMAFFEGIGSGTEGLRWYLALGFLISAVIAAGPLVLARVGLSRMIASDAWWIAPLLRASIAIAGLAVVLRLVSAVLAMTEKHPGMGSILGR